MSDSRFVAVLGMHRSGTSAVTRALNIMGVTLPGELMHNTHHNASGHWEALEAVSIHDELLAANAYTWDDPFIPLDICTRNLDAQTQALSRISAFLKTTVAANSIAALKDPRLCHTLPLWVQALAHVHTPACAIIMVRNPLEVAASLQARDGMPQSVGLQLWVRYMLAAERNTRSIPRAVIYYDTLLHDWRTALTPVCTLLGMSVPAADSHAAQQLTTFLSRDERHHTIESDAVHTQAQHIPGVTACYRQCLQTIDGADAATMFDSITAQLATHDATIPTHVHELMRYHMRHAQQEIDTLKAEISWRAGINDAQSQELEWRKSVMVAHKLER